MRSSLSSLLLLSSAVLTTSSPSSALRTNTYPLFEQCDPRWGNDPMGVNGPGERSTICGEGCAMSALAMVLGGLGIPVPDPGTGTPQPATPGTFNAWLEANNGYHCDAGDCNNLVLDVVSNLTGAVQLIGELTPPPIASIETGLTAGNVAYLAHVRNRTHFVLLTGFVGAGSGVFTVNDPNAHNTTYTYAEMADILMYALLAPPPTTPQPSSLRGGGSAPRVSASPVVPFPYPLYKQCNASWGSDLMVNQTICSVGCLMSSTAMALAGHGITDAGVTIDPGTFNAWLRTHNGYEGPSDLEEDAVPAIDPAHVGWNDAGGMHRTNDVPFPQIQALVAKGQPVIANVMQGRHFVLVIGWDASDSDTLYVNDPGFATLSYSYSKDVVGWRLFNMTQA